MPSGRLISPSSETPSCVGKRRVPCVGRCQAWRPRGNRGVSGSRCAMRCPGRISRIVRGGKPPGTGRLPPRDQRPGCAGHARDARRRDSGSVPGNGRGPDAFSDAARGRDGRRHGARALGRSTDPGSGDGGGGRGSARRAPGDRWAIRTLLGGETLGDGPRACPSPRRPVPIWVSALGPKAMRLAGEIADGVILNWCPPERVPFARARIGEGAESSGAIRPPSPSPCTCEPGWGGRGRGHVGP